MYTSNLRLQGQTQSVFIGTGKLIGIQSLNIVNNFSASPINYLGIGNKFGGYTVNGPQFASVNINSLLLNTDNFIYLTGNESINIYILNDKIETGNNYSLISGYMESYSAKYSNNQPVQITTNFKFYRHAGLINPTTLNYSSTGINNITDENYDIIYDESSNAIDEEFLSNIIQNDLVTIASNNYDYLENNILVANGGSVDIAIDEQNHNRVIDYSVDITIPRKPIYGIGNKFPVRNEIIYPIDVNCSVIYEISNNQSGYNFMNFPQSPKRQNINIQINNYQQNDNISRLNFENMTLINETRSVNIDGNVTISAIYNGKIFR